MLASPCNVGQGPTLAGMEGAKGSEVAGSNGGSAIVELGRSGGPPGRVPQTAKPGDKLWQWTWDNITKLSPVFDRPQFAHGFTGAQSAWRPRRCRKECPLLPGDRKST